MNIVKYPGGKERELEIISKFMPSIVKNYYDYQGEESVQEDSLVYYGNTYMQNSGVDYGMETEFEVVSILDGTVMEVLDDEVMGKTIKIKHNNDLISVYQSLGSVDVKVNDSIYQGAIIGKSGVSNVSRDLGNHLHFEIYKDNKLIIMPAFHTLTFIYTINILFVRNCKLYILYSFEIHPYLRGEKFKNHTTIPLS